MRMSEGGRGRGGPFERMDHAQLIQGFSDQIMVADAHFLVLVVELTPFLKHFCLLVSVSVVADKEVEPGRDGIASLKRWLS